MGEQGKGTASCLWKAVSTYSVHHFSKEFKMKATGYEIKPWCVGKMISFLYTKRR